MINLTEEFGKGEATKRLLDDFYSPTQLGFVFFAFIFFKFMYKIVYDDKGDSKKTKDGREIYKKFKIYLPFGFKVNKLESILRGQQQPLTIYKQLQGVALDLFKYIYPEPIFEFTTYETYDSVILMIRFTPFMKFNRPLTSPQTLTVGQSNTNEDMIPVYQEKSYSTQEYFFDPNSYNTIERLEFGHNRIKSVRETGTGASPASLLRDHLEETGAEATPGQESKRIITTIQQAVSYSKKMNVEDLIANDDESDWITEKFFNVIPIDTRYLETLNMTRSASSVVNVIWTVPTTDTVLLKMSGRELIYAYLEQRLNEVGGLDKFGNYVYRQFEEDFDANPVFLMDYRGVYGNRFISGDMSYFGFREFEIKWNYLSVLYNTTSHLLAGIDKAVLKEARKLTEDKTMIKMLDDGMRAGDDPLTQSTYIGKDGKVVNPRRRSDKIFNAFSAGITQSDMSSGALARTPVVRTSSRTFNKYIHVRNKESAIDKARKEKLYKAALARYSKEGVIDKNTINSATKIIDLLKYAKKEDAKLMGGFVSKINRVVAEAYRENEHLYECSIVKPIDITILPGMIVESSNESKKAKSPWFKGYVTSISHVIDFNQAMMKTTLNVSRTASDDSGVYLSTNSEK
jgi:hypothetical protein